jgi:UDP-3-O-[3-hydroxymyristoyl] glucosamine N-acyltransferase
MEESRSRAEDRVLSLAAVAEAVEGTLHGDGALEVRAIAPLDEAGPDELAPLTSKRYAKYAQDSRAGAFLVGTGLERYIDADRPRVVVADPQRALLTLLRRLHPAEPEAEGVHPTAVLGRGVRLGARVAIGPYAVLGDGVEVGDGSRVGAHTVLGPNAKVGRDCTLHPHVVLYANSVLEDRVILHSGVRIGADGFGYVQVDGAHERIPHVGRAVIQSDVEIGANTTVDRGSIGDTVVEPGAKLDNLVMIAHNVRVGAGSMLAGLVGVAGSTRMGKGVWAGGQAGMINHLEIGDGARLAVASKVMRDVPPGQAVSGHPARPHREDLARQAQLGRIHKLVARVEALEAEIEALRPPRPPPDPLDR